MFTLSIVFAILATLAMTFVWRLHCCLQQAPHFKIGRAEDADWYMFRWYVIPRNMFGFNIYLHKVLRDDDPAALHDHPWANLSWVLPHWLMRLLNISIPARGNGYVEVMPYYRPSEYALPAAYQAPNLKRIERDSGAIVVRRATDAHRLVLHRDTQERPIPSWSLFITGPYQRKWGFWCPRGWVPYDQYVKRTAEGNEFGAGCGEAQ